ncbi:thiopurine S-methyltransferase [Luteimonas sp. MJ293]|uniref:thiopurine S-methyltransferase n=1 Tax=Luteimonas sp. MJ146 TaxID=3129240 RepID=UPI0031BB905C
MEPDFWHERWQAGRIGFHQDRPLPLLCKHWPALELAPDSRVFVPLCGKSVDMAWLAERGHRVLGVELSEVAVRQFFDDCGLAPATHDSRFGIHYSAGPFELICGDAFALDEAALADCAAVYDRAALIALPPEMRARYADTLWRRLPAGCDGLLITLEYPQEQKNGPPFSVIEAEVRQLLEPEWDVSVLERRDILANEDRFREAGVTALNTTVYRTRRR